MSLEEVTMQVNEIRSRILADEPVSPEEMAAVIADLRKARKAAGARTATKAKKEKAEVKMPENILDLFN